MNETAAKDKRKLNILIVDDEFSVLKLLEAMLKHAGYDAVGCESGSEALRVLDTGSFDLLLTDALMPNMSGYDLVKAVRKHPVYSTLPVLMLTRKRQRTDVKRAVDVGVTDYIVKPVDEYLLLDKVELCIKKGEGKRHVFEWKLAGSDLNSQIHVDCRIVSISETDMTMNLPGEMVSNTNFKVTSQIFEEIGISSPLLKLIRCDQIIDSADAGRTVYRAKLAFVGLPEQDLMKIRSWIQRKSAQQLASVR
jgi:DNA-binding response OmpR family regulator